MGFERALAEQFQKSDDRDVALFFAGRGREIEQFDDAVDAAGAVDEDGNRVKRQALFRIYQGAPGCGKTSLARHLANTRGDRIVFVPIELKHLRDDGLLMRRILEETVGDAPAYMKMFSETVRAAGEHLKLAGLADITVEGVAKYAAKDKRLVLHLDEAHGLTSKEGETLVTLHTIGIGAPCVLMLTGLGHTKQALTSIKRLSRAADNATTEMGKMKREECVESTLNLLDALNAEGAAHEHEALAALTADLAHGWPQHLNRAQAALCGELLRVGGVAGRVDRARIRDASDRSRHRYYEARLDHSLFRLDPTTTLKIVADVQNSQVLDMGDLHTICDRRMKQAKVPELFEGVRPLEFAKALIEKGIFTHKPRTRIQVAIPSMAEWAEIDWRAN